MPSEQSPRVLAAGIIFRRAAAFDADRLSAIWLRSFAAALPLVPRRTDAEVQAWMRYVLIPNVETWVASIEGTAVALLSLDGGEIEQLYVDPAWQGRGIGDACIRHAKSRFPLGLGLWTFQVNTAARRCYATRGFVETAVSDGCRNEEGEPDVRMEWSPASD